MIQQKLINLRKKTGLTQEQMAKSIAMEQTTYSRKELGKSSITNDDGITTCRRSNVAKAIYQIAFYTKQIFKGSNRKQYAHQREHKKQPCIQITMKQPQAKQKHKYTKPS